MILFFHAFDALQGLEKTIGSATTNIDGVTDRHPITHALGFCCEPSSRLQTQVAREVEARGDDSLHFVEMAPCC